MGPHRRDLPPPLGIFREGKPDMVITDLKQTCSRCGGSGHQPGFTAMGISQIKYDGRCPVCSGRGFQLTELGEDLVTLLKPFIQELIQGETPESAKPPKLPNQDPSA